MNDRVRPAEEAVFSLLVGAEHRVLPVKKLPVHGLVAGLALPVGLHHEICCVFLGRKLRRGLAGEKFLRAYDLALQAKQEEVANKLSSPQMGM